MLDVMLTEKSGAVVKQYVAKLEGGELRIDANRRVTGLTGIIRSLQTADKKSMFIIKGEVRDGALLLTTAEGAVYAVYDMSSPSMGSLRLEKAATATNRR